MPVNSTIPLSIRPPQIPPPDIAKSYLTLAQFRELQANTARLAGVEGRAQATFDQAAGAGRFAGTLNTPPPAAPAPPGPAYTNDQLGALDAGESTPAAAPTAPPRQRDILDPDVQAEGRARFPQAWQQLTTDVLTSRQSIAELDLKKQTVRNAKVETLSRSAGLITDQASLDTFRTALAGILEPEELAQLPTTYTPELVPKIQATAQSVAAQLEQTLQQRKVAVEEAQQRTAAFQAETARRIQERPYPLGPGYGLDPRAPRPQTLGPSGAATQAPRSPEGQALYNTLSGEFQQQSQVLAKQTATYNKAVTVAKDKTNTSDRALLHAYTEMVGHGGGTDSVGTPATQGLGNIQEMVSSELNRLLTDKSGTLDDGLRQKVLTTIKKLHAVQIDQHLQIRDDIRTKGRAQGLPADEVAPNRLTTHGSGGQRISAQTFADIMTKAQAQGKTRGEVLLDLAEKGFHVQGGPQ